MFLGVVTVFVVAVVVSVVVASAIVFVWSGRLVILILVSLHVPCRTVPQVAWRAAADVDRLCRFHMGTAPAVEVSITVWLMHCLMLVVLIIPGAKLHVYAVTPLEIA